MTAPTRSGPPLRSAELSRDALATNLTDLRVEHGDDIVLDLRADAVGCGVEEVARIARDVQIRFCLLDQNQPVPTGLTVAPLDAPAVSGWWGGRGGAVVTFSATVISVKAVAPGTPVSYGYEYRTTSDTTLALVSAGFADGVPRSAGGTAMIAIGGTTFPIAGRIAMDQCVVDVGQARVAVGDRATLWGEAPTLTQWSAWSARPEAALLTHLGSRVVTSWT